MGINLRRPTQAEIQPGQIQEEHLADGSVNLQNAKVTGQLPNGKLGIIADVNKIQDDIITLAKCKDDVKVNTFIGGEVEQSVTGITEEDIVDTGFANVANKYKARKLRIITTLKVEGQPGDIAYLKLYIDDEVSPRSTLQTTETTYQLLSDEIDISDLPDGRHQIYLKGYTSDVAAKCWNDYIDILFVK